MHKRENISKALWEIRGGRKERKNEKLKERKKDNIRKTKNDMSEKINKTVN